METVLRESNLLAQILSQTHVLPHASEVDPGSMIGEKTVFWVQSFLGGSSTVVILSLACEFPTVISSPYNCSIPRSDDWKAVYFRAGAIVGLETQLNGRRSYLWESSLLELATHLLLAHRGQRRG